MRDLTKDMLYVPNSISYIIKVTWTVVNYCLLDLVDVTTIYICDKYHKHRYM